MEKEFEAFKNITEFIEHSEYYINCFNALKREYCQDKLKVEQALTELKAIKEAKPSETMKLELETLLERANHDELLFRKDTEFCENFLEENQNYYNTIKQALLKAQEQEKKNVEYKEALRIIFEKEVDIELLKKETTTFEDYNKWIEFVDSIGVNIPKNRNRQLTQEEFNTLKKVLE